MNRKKILTGLVSVFFPQRCACCGRVIVPSALFCEECLAALPKTVYERSAVGGFLCSAALLYEEPYSTALKRFKFHSKPGGLRGFAYLTVKAARERFAGKDFDAVTCVPMTRLAVFKRGYNQSEELARACAKLMALPFEPVLEKYRSNAPQRTLNRSQRAKNVRGVFRIRKSHSVTGKRYLLIDDVITTGSTLGECARVLKTGGCSEVCCAVLCTTPE
ncbi:MAG: ComF family protein [Ruminococcus sp.]|nr:ComF family protein [Ruminococcus sp.]